MSDLNLQALLDALDECCLPDRFPLRRQLMQVRKMRSPDAEKQQRQLQRITARIADSRSRLERRKTSVPQIRFPAELPVSQRLDDIKNAISQHQVVIIAGETGSGKTTQIPKICLELGRGVAGTIGHTQPRRLAARNVALRIAEELNTPLGEGVGYQVRFQDTSSELTHIKLMTDGVLLAAINQDRFLNQYDTIIIDEAHERSLNIDFLLGYLKTLLPKRPDLKLIITSATIDVDRFSRHFDNAPVVEVSGRSFPVELRYRPMEDAESNDLGDGIAQVLLELRSEGADRRGDVLVFLSGERDIRDVHNFLKRSNIAGLEVLPLYARLSQAEQQRIFDLQRRRGWRVVLATNVAETSLTVPGIHYVIDAGTARISRYSVRSKVQRLPIEPVSQASANQRAGRCGRLAPGIAYRLYSEQDFDRRPVYTEPEIQRTNLAAVILQMLQLGLGEIENFPFIDPPDQRLINDGYGLLQELGAVNRRQLNTLGRRLAQFPADPRIARLLLAAAEQSCLSEMLIIASALSIQDPRDRPSDKQQAADEKHRRFVHPDSDFMAYLALWDYAEEQRQALSSNQWRKLCQKEFLSWMRMREWREVHHQLRILCRQLKLPVNQQPADYNNLHRALLPGFLGQIACKIEQREYLGARSRKLRIFPGSVLTKKSPPWIVAAELAETSQLFARTVAKIEAEWVLGINDELLKRQYYQPHFQPRTGNIVAFEQTLLYGLLIRDKVKINYAPIAPQECREIFIRQALVEGRYRGRAAFFRHNRRLIDDIAGLEDKIRRRDILVSDEELYHFYNSRLPDSIVSVRHMEHWLKQQGPDALKLRRSDAMRIADPGAGEAQFPDQLNLAGIQLPLKYHFQPGHVADGVSVEVPLAQLDVVPESALQWLVPGLLRDKCIALVKALPKAQRKQLVPVPDFVDRALEEMVAGEGALFDSLAKALHRVSGLSIDAAAWSSVSLDDFYRMNIRVLDDSGKAIGEGRDLQALRRSLSDRVQSSISQETGNGFEIRSGSDWQFGQLDVRYQFQQGGATLTAYPCLQDEGDQVKTALAESELDAQRHSMIAVQRLLLLRMAPQCKVLRKDLFRGNQQQLQFAAGKQQRQDWLESALMAAARAVFNLSYENLPRDASAFERVLNAGRGDFVPCVEQYERLLSEVLKSYSDICRQLKNCNSLSWIHSINDIQQQLASLFAPGFIQRWTLQELQEYPRYLKAIAQRLEKLNGNYPRDRQCTLILTPFQEYLDKLMKSASVHAFEQLAWREFRWMLEEFRVSLFAQSLGTRFPVSEKRLKSAMKAVQSVELAA